MALDLSKFITRFIDEAREQLRLLEEGLGSLQGTPSNAEQINSLFRAAHTLKGSARMLKLLPIAETAHSLEDVLSALREQKITLQPADTDVLLATLDHLSNLTEHLAKQPDPAALPAKDEALCAQLAAIASGTTSASAEAAPAENQTSATPPADESVQVAGPLRQQDSVRLKLDNLEQLIRLMSEISISQAGLREAQDSARELLLQLERSHADEGLTEHFRQFYRQLNEITGTQESLVHSLHQQSLSLRMLPLSQIFEPARKLVRELGRELGKAVELKLYGENIELDRQLIEQLAEPVQHLLRNAIDHGLEDPDVRQAAGKPARGTLVLGAQQKGGWVSLTLSDDGAGLNLDSIRDKALKQKLFSEEELTHKNPQEVRNLIFHPGFSTSTLITELSGRGVGLDVVKSSVEALQGSVDVSSSPGQGTRFVLRLPLSLAIMRILLVEVAGQLLAFSARHVFELIRQPADSLLDVAGRRVFVLRNEFVPVFDLQQLIGLPDAPRKLQASRHEDLLLVIRIQDEKLALRIDQLVDERDLVIRPLPGHLRNQPLVAGMVNHGYRQLASLIHAPHLLVLARSSRQDSGPADSGERPGQHILVVDDSFNTREIEKDLLEAHGYRVTLAEHGQDGLDKALAVDFDAILTDVEMPIMDGFTLTSHLRQEPRYQDKPIIIITSREQDSDRRRGIEVGADAYIVKGSFDQSSLIDTLRLLLG